MNKYEKINTKQIRYKSTRGLERNLSFEEVVLGGLAKDKGLYVPENIPELTLDDIENMRSMSFTEVAFKIITCFISEDDIPHLALQQIINKSFASFRSEDVTPTIKLRECWILELFHGPTFAFKDVALQFLGNVFEFFLKRGNIQKRLTILGATSGDTGSAAIHGLRGKENVNCFIMYPEGKVTEIQEKQMTSILDDNIYCIKIKGDFDDAQSIVKAAFADSNFRDKVNLGAINSINWARVLAQITYYFYSWLHVTDSIGKGTPINFAVPTGNFGDILAGYYAKCMGLPIDKLIICTNENGVLHRFMKTGTYKKAPSVLTIAPSMDISISSNFERYLYYLASESSDTLRNWMETFESTGEVTLTPMQLAKAKQDFLSCSSTKEEIVQTMRSVYEQEKYLLCPHTSTGVVAVRNLKLPAENTVCLATAHPAKFEEATRLALKNGLFPPKPQELEALTDCKTRSHIIENKLDAIQSFVVKSLNQDNDSKTPSTNDRNKFYLILFITVAAISIVVVMRQKR